MEIISSYINTLADPTVIITGVLFALFLILKNDSIYNKVKGNFTPERTAKKKKAESNTSIEDMMKDLFCETNQEDVQYYKTMNKKLPLSLRVKQGLRGLYFNPYNDKSISSLVMNMLFGVVLAVIVSIAGMTNIMYSIPLAPAMALIPYLYLQARITKNRVSIQENNLMLFTTFTGTYSESSDINTALKKTASLYSPQTREYKALMNASDLLSSLSLHNVLQRMKVDLLADESICLCIDTIESCEHGSRLYKRTFEHILMKYEELIKVNKESQMATAVLTHAYTGMLFVILGFLIYYRYFNEDIIDSLYHQFSGQLSIFILFIVYSISGLFIQKLTIPIKYINDEYMKEGGQ